MRLGGKIDDRVELVLGKDRLHCLAVRDVGLEELVAVRMLLADAGPGHEGAVVRMFRRLRETPKRVTKVEWPVTPDWEAPVPAMVFSGDTLHLLAGFRTQPAGNVRVTISGAPGGERQDTEGQESAEPDRVG